MAMSPNMASKPQRDNVPAGTYAIRIGETQEIWRLRESDDPFSDSLEWEPVGSRAIDSVPKSSYEGGRWESDEDGDIWFYVEEINPEKEVEARQVQLEDTAPYSVELITPDGEHRRITGGMQADVFEEVIEVLITEFDLAKKLELPFVPGYKNAVITEEPRHPNGEEMERARALAGGEFYMSTSPTKEQKRDYLNTFADLTGSSIRFSNGWND
jgi:hypothetical protein